MTALPTNIDATYADDPSDGSYKLHQQHHDEIHGRLAATIVDHGATAGTARPTGASLVLWVGTVAPTNAVTGDEWKDQTNDLWKRWDGSAWVAAGSATYVAAVAAPTGVAATDSANIQGAHDALPSTGGEIRLRRGTYALGTTSINISKPGVTIVGEGGSMIGDGSFAASESAATTITYSSSIGTAISGVGGCRFRDFALINTSGVTPTAGAGIAPTVGSYMDMEGVTVAGFYDNVVPSGQYFSVRNNWFFDAVQSDIHIDNGTGTLNDHGAWSILNNVFVPGMFTNRSTQNAILWKSGGGGRIIGNQINGGPIYGNTTGGTWTHGIHLATLNGITTGDIQIVGNDINGFSDRGVSLTTDDMTGTSTGQLNYVLVTGNRINVTEGGGTGIGVFVGGAFYTSVSNVEIAGNQFNVLTTSIMVANARSVHIGVNDHTGITGTPVVIGDGTGTFSQWPIGLTMDRQGFYLSAQETGSRYLVQDFRTMNNDGGRSGVVDHRYARQLKISAAATFQTVYEIGAYNAVQTGGAFTVRMIGHDWDDGPVYMEQRRAWTIATAGAAPTLATIGTDVAAGAGTANISIGYVLAAGPPGTIKVQAKVIGGAIHTFEGMFEIEAFGHVAHIWVGPN
jgi:hypothetical protein